MWLAEKQQTQILLVIGLTWLGLEPTIYCTWEHWEQDNSPPQFFFSFILVALCCFTLFDSTGCLFSLFPFLILCDKFLIGIVFRYTITPLMQLKHRYKLEHYLHVICSIFQGTFLQILQTCRKYCFKIYYQKGVINALDFHLLLYLWSKQWDWLSCLIFLELFSTSFCTQHILKRL